MSVTVDNILDGMAAALQPLLVQNGGTLRSAKRYMGKGLSPEDASDEGIMGRSPSALVAFDGERPYRGTLGGRRERIEASFTVYVSSDSHRSKDDRRQIFPASDAVIPKLAKRRLGLSIDPLKYNGLTPFLESEQIFVYAARFTTRYVRDFTIDPGNDLLLAADGQIVGSPLDNPAGPPAPSILVNGVPGTAHYAYDVQYLDASGVYSNWSPWTKTELGPAVLGVVNSITASWPAVAGATQYRLRRRWAPVGVSLGIIYAGALLTFIDTGAIVANGDVEPARGLTYDGDF